MQTANVMPELSLAWGAKGRPLPGQTVSGDLNFVKQAARHVLMAVLDGVGHGNEAASAARKAAVVLEEHTEEAPVPLIKRCHEALKNTRGVAMTIASVDPLASTLSWVGVGNVEALLIRANANGQRDAERLLLRSGLVGYELPELRISTVPLTRGDLIVFATDGIQAGFGEGWRRTDPTEQIASNIMEMFSKGSDDALVLVARYIGLRHE